MKTTHTYLVMVITVLVIGITLITCQKEEDPELQVQDTPPVNNNTPKKMDLDEIDQFELGRMLFYDKSLSASNTVSCASCHKQSHAFSDNMPLSIGFNNQKTFRNSLPIQNLSASTPLFWDGREDNPSNMVLQPIVNHLEMGITNFDQVVMKLQSKYPYPEIFDKLYGESKISQKNIANALTNFIFQLRSTSSKFDRGETFSALETYGEFLFNSKYPCNDCHDVSSPTGYLTGGTIDQPFTSIGLDMEADDKGLGSITGLASDNGKFKVPSLRNVALTAPYMHDGRFKTLFEVVDHYSTGMMNSPNLDDRLKDSQGNALRMSISEEEKKAMVAFLNTFTDDKFIEDPRFSDPFK